MKWIYRAAIAVLATMMTATAGAAEIQVSSTLYAVYPLHNGAFALMFNDTIASCSSTANPKRFYVKVEHASMTVEGAKQIYAAALFALAAEKVVWFVFDDATGDCYVNRLMVTK